MTETRVPYETETSRQAGARQAFRRAAGYTQAEPGFDSQVTVINVADQLRALCEAQRETIQKLQTERDRLRARLAMAETVCERVYALLDADGIIEGDPDLTIQHGSGKSEAIGVPVTPATDPG